MASNAEVLAPEVTGLPAVVRPAADSAIVNPLVTVEEAKAAWEHYQRLTSAILDDSDYQTIGSKKFKKKAAWRKYMRFYGLDEDESRTRIEVSRNGQQFNVPGLPVAFPVFASAFVVVRSGNGKTWTGYHECHVSEKCCPAAVSQPCDKKGWSKHKCCAQGCSGMVHFSHPGDLPATAHTRAKNRAISDAIGAGEVSAEEAEGGRGNASGEDEREPQHICPGCGKTGAVMQSKAEYGGGWLCWKKGKTSDGQPGCGWRGQEEPPLEKLDQDEVRPPTAAPAPAGESQGQPGAGAEGPQEPDGKTLFLEACKVLKLGKGDLPDLYDYLRHYLGSEDIEAMEPFAKAERIKQLLLQEKKKPGSAVPWMRETAATYRAGKPAPTKEAPPPQPPAAPQQATTKSQAATATLIERYMALCHRLGPDGLSLMNRYLNQQPDLGHAVTTCTDPKKRERYANIFEALERMDPQQLRGFLTQAPSEDPGPGDDGRYEAADEDVPF